jgi:hypothetical protein
MHHNQEDHNPNTHLCENIKTYKNYSDFATTTVVMNIKTFGTPQCSPQSMLVVWKVEVF